MAVKFLKHKWQQVIVTVLLVLVALLLLAAFVLNRYFSPILASQLKSTILKSTDSLYHVSFDEAKLDLLQGKITIYNIKLNPDTAVYRQKKKAHTAPEQLYTLKVEELTLNHIHPFKLLLKHQVDVGQILLNTPEINIAFRPDPQKDTKPKDKRTLYQRISKSFKMIRVGQIRLTNVRLKYENFSGSKPAISAFKDLDLGADDLLIDSATQFDHNRFLYCRELTAALKNYSGRSTDALYAYQAKLIKYSTRSGQLHIDDFTVRSLQNAASFFQKTYDDRFFLYLGSIQFNNFDFDIFNQSHTIKASSLVLSKGNISVFSNPRTNPKSFFIDKAITFPNKAIRTLPFKLKIDTVKVQQYAVKYEELNLKAKKKGHITFEHINGQFYNVATDSAALKRNQFCVINVNAQFMGRAQTHLKFIFNLNDSLYSYSYHGVMGPINLQAVNVATVPLASININSGQATQFKFDIQGNRHMARGKVTLLYNNLKIQLLNADSSQLKSLHLALASLLANALIIKNNNPDHAGEPPRIANVVYQRPINYPFFETLWRTLLTGIKSSAGLDAKNQQDADVKQAQKQKEHFFDKSDKSLRKKQRQEKRRLKKLAKAQKKAAKKAEKERIKAQKQAAN